MGKWKNVGETSESCGCTVEEYNKSQSREY